MIPDAIEKRLELMQNDLSYLRNKLDKLESELRSLIWRVAGIGAGSGALGFVLSLLIAKMS